MGAVRHGHPISRTRTAVITNATPKRKTNARYRNSSWQTKTTPKQKPHARNQNFRIAAIANAPPKRKPIGVGGTGDIEVMNFSGADRVLLVTGGMMGQMYDNSNDDQDAPRDQASYFKDDRYPSKPTYRRFPDFDDETKRATICLQYLRSSDIMAGDKPQWVAKIGNDIKYTKGSEEGSRWKKHKPGWVELEWGYKLYREKLAAAKGLYDKYKDFFNMVVQQHLQGTNSDYSLKRSQRKVDDQEKRFKNQLNAIVRFTYAVERRAGDELKKNRTPSNTQQLVTFLTQKHHRWKERKEIAKAWVSFQSIDSVKL